MKKFFVLFVLLVVLSVNLVAQDRVDIQVNPSSANLWYFHTPEKGLNFYFLKVWPNGYLLTKFGPPAMRVNKTTSVSIGIGPDINVKAKRLKDMFESFTLDVVPAVFSGRFSAVLVNEVGINKDGKSIYFLRHSIDYGQVGVRWSSCGTFGEKAYFFQMGPTVRFGKLQLWVANDLLGNEWLVEASFSIKL
jgi:hypothetical protein